MKRQRQGVVDVDSMSTAQVTELRQALRREARFFIRSTKSNVALWKKCARRAEQSLTEWAERHLNEAAKR